MSQKDLLDEGIASLLKGAAKKTGQAIGAVGSAVKAASEQGLGGTWVSAAKAGAEGWKKTGDMLTSRKKKLEEYLDDNGIMMHNSNPPGSLQGGHGLRGKKKLAVLDIIQYDYDQQGKKIPMKGEKVELRKFKFKDGRWEQVRDKQRKWGEWGRELDRADLSEIKTDDDDHLLKKGTIVTHKTKGKKGPGVAFGYVIGYTLDESMVGIEPFPGSKSPGVYGKTEKELTQSTEAEAKKHYGGSPTPGPSVVTSSTCQKDLLRQLHMLRG